MTNTSATHSDTKRLLADSLKKLMLAKPLGKISIHEITKDCGLNRQTFYYHFHDIYDLLEWLFTKEAEEVLKCKDRPLTVREGILRILDYIRRNEAFCLCTLHSIGHSHLRKFFYDAVNHVNLLVVEECGADLDVPEQYMDLIAHYYTISFSALIEDWLRNGLKEEPEVIVRLCEATTPGTVRKTLESFSTNPPKATVHDETEYKVPLQWR